MSLKTAGKAAAITLGTAAVTALNKVSDLASSTSEEKTGKKWMDDPNNPGGSIFMPYHETVIHQGMPLQQAWEAAIPTSMKEAAIAGGVYLAYKGGKKLHQALGPQWRGRKK